MLRSTTELRHELHRNPELSGNEKVTASLLKEYLLPRNPDRLITGLGGHGILSVYQAGTPGPSILLRCDMDAVPVEKGCSHNCGHDGHMAILAGVADHFHRNPPGRGSVLLLFQPAEETGQGAAAILRNGVLEEFSPHAAFAIHNLPGFPAGSVVVRRGCFAEASCGLIIRFRGRSSHAGEPLKGISPAPAMAELITKFEEMCVHRKGILITVVHAVIGERAFGTSPEKAVLMATLRAPSNTAMQRLSSSALELVQIESSKHGLQFSVEWTEEFPATENSPGAVDTIERAARSLNIPVVRLKKPFPWSEDFGHFTSAYGGALFGLGAGTESPPLHDPSYDFPDTVTESGVALLSEIARRALVSVPGNRRRGNERMGR